MVATNVGGIPEAVEDGATGLLVPPDDSYALAEAIKWLLQHPEERERMGHAGCRLVYERFDMRRSTAELMQIYRELAAQTRGR